MKTNMFLKKASVFCSGSKIMKHMEKKEEITQENSGRTVKFSH